MHARSNLVNASSIRLGFVCYLFLYLQSFQSLKGRGLYSAATLTSFVLPFIHVCTRASAGITDVNIGDTVMNKDDPVHLPPISVEEPTVRMSISVNKSPLAGREGKLLQV